MSETFVIEAEPRSDEGKGASRRLRRQGLVPGIIYGGPKKPAMISLVHSDLILHLEHEAFYSHILEVKLGSDSEQVILKDLQRHPAKPFVMHVDFQRVSAKKKLRTHVPFHFVGEASAPGVKMGGVVSHHLTDVEVSCLPKDLPEYIEVDLSQMDLGDSVSLSGLKLPAGVEIPLLATGPEHDMMVASLHSARGPVEGEGEEGEEAAGESEE